MASLNSGSRVSTQCTVALRCLEKSRYKAMYSLNSSGVISGSARPKSTTRVEPTRWYPGVPSSEVVVVVFICGRGAEPPTLVVGVVEVEVTTGEMNVTAELKAAIEQ